MRSTVSTANGGASAFGASGRCMRGNQRHQLGPRHHQVHLVEELSLARPLRLAPVSTLAKAHLFHVANVSHHAGTAEVVQTFPSFRHSNHFS